MPDEIPYPTGFQIFLQMSLVSRGTEKKRIDNYRNIEHNVLWTLSRFRRLHQSFRRSIILLLNSLKRLPLFILNWPIQITNITHVPVMFSCKHVQLIKNQYRNAHFQKRMRKSQDDYYWLVKNNTTTNTINTNKFKTRKLTLCNF